MKNSLRNRNVDMREGPILSRILVFALPIFLGSVFQQFYSMVDSIVVGKFVNADALAAVGSTATISMVLLGVLRGFPMGASIVAAQFLGAGQVSKIKASISTTLWFLVGLAGLLMVAGLIIVKPLMHWVNVPDNIYDDSVTYFRIYMFGMIFMGLYNFFASFLRALGDSTTPLIFLIISSVLNIAGDLFFVLVLHMGVAGVAWATVIAQGVSVVLCFLYSRKVSEYFRFGKGEMIFDRVLFKDILRLGLPSSIQSSITGIGMVFVQSLINSFGSVSMAAYTAANKMEQLCNLPMQGISQALALFVGQNIGAGKTNRAQKGMYQSLGASVVLSIFMSMIIFFFGRGIMLLFVNADEAEVITIGAKFMRRWAPFVFTHAFFQVIVSFLRGAGDSIHSMIAMFFDLITRAVAAYLFAVVFGLGFMGIAWSLICGWSGATIYSAIRYIQGGWKSKAVVKKGN